METELKLGLCLLQTEIDFQKTVFLHLQVFGMAEKISQPEIVL